MFQALILKSSIVPQQDSCQISPHREVHPLQFHLEENLWASLDLDHFLNEYFKSLRPLKYRLKVNLGSKGFHWLENLFKSLSNTQRFYSRIRVWVARLKRAQVACAR